MIFMDIDRSRLAFSVEDRINVELFRAASRDLSFFEGNAPEEIALHCMIFFWDILSSMKCEACFICL